MRVSGQIMEGIAGIDATHRNFDAIAECDFESPLRALWNPKLARSLDFYRRSELKTWKGHFMTMCGSRL